MDAPRLFPRLTICLVVACGFLLPQRAQAASARSQNFLVSAATQELAVEVAKAAEGFRRDLAKEWLGKELPDWEQPCPITVQVDPRMGAGGATSFMFGNGRPYGWTMKIFGSRERVLDSVLPHEVTHTIFATHFGRPLPRWADEGACTTVEDVSERSKQEKLLYQFLQTNRGIAFNKMFAMKEYPRDMLPLYSQGYSLVRFLISLEGKQRFVKYVGAGMDSNNWTAATKEHYGFHSLSDLQLSWLEWVRQGTPKLKDANDVLYVSTDANRNGRTLAEVNGTATPLASAVAQLNDPPRSRDYASARGQLGGTTPIAFKTNAPAPRSNRSATLNDGASNAATKPARLPPANQLPARPQRDEARPSGDGWYARRRDQAQAGRREDVAMQPAARDEGASSFTSSSRPQPPEQVKQSAVGWNKNERSLGPVGQ